MKPLQSISLLFVLVLASACGGGDNAADPGSTDGTTTPASPGEQASGADRATTDAGEPVEIVPGLTARILKTGDGATAQIGQTAVVHYSGWLYAENAPDHRGAKFDSSLDRGEYFEFPVGAGRVIRGWDQGVAGMQVGEVRELTIAPELAYGERGAGDAIPPGATLVFEVQLAGLKDGASPSRQGR